VDSILSCTTNKDIRVGCEDSVIDFAMQVSKAHIYL